MNIWIRVCPGLGWFRSLRCPGVLGIGDCLRDASAATIPLFDVRRGSADSEFLIGIAEATALCLEGRCEILEVPEGWDDGISRARAGAAQGRLATLKSPNTEES
jgi:hypothetical protein